MNIPTGFTGMKYVDRTASSEAQTLSESGLAQRTFGFITSKARWLTGYHDQICLTRKLKNRDVEEVRTEVTKEQLFKFANSSQPSNEETAPIVKFFELACGNINLTEIDVNALKEATKLLLKTENIKLLVALLHCTDIMSITTTLMNHPALLTLDTDSLCKILKFTDPNSVLVYLNQNSTLLKLDKQTWDLILEREQSSNASAVKTLESLLRNSELLADKTALENMLQLKRNITTEQLKRFANGQSSPEETQSIIEFYEQVSKINLSEINMGLLQDITKFFLTKGDIRVVVGLLHCTDAESTLNILNSLPTLSMLDTESLCAILNFVDPNGILKFIDQNPILMEMHLSEQTWNQINEHEESSDESPIEALNSLITKHYERVNAELSQLGIDTDTASAIKQLISQMKNTKFVQPLLSCTDIKSIMTTLIEHLNVLSKLDTNSLCVILKFSNPNEILTFLNEEPILIRWLNEAIWSIMLKHEQSSKESPLKLLNFLSQNPQLVALENIILKKIINCEEPHKILEVLSHHITFPKFKLETLDEILALEHPAPALAALLKIINDNGNLLEEKTEEIRHFLSLISGHDLSGVDEQDLVTCCLFWFRTQNTTALKALLSKAGTGAALITRLGQYTNFINLLISKNNEASVEKFFAKDSVIFNKILALQPSLAQNIVYSLNEFPALFALNSDILELAFNPKIASHTLHSALANSQLLDRADLLKKILESDKPELVLDTLSKIPSLSEKYGAVDEIIAELNEKK